MAINQYLIRNAHPGLWCFKIRRFVFASQDSSSLKTCNQLDLNICHFHAFPQLNTKESDPKNKSVLLKKGTRRTNDIIESMRSQILDGRIEHAIEQYEKLKQDNGPQLTDHVALALLNCLLRAKRFNEAKQLVIDLKSFEPSTTKESGAILCSIFDKLVDQLDLDELNWYIDNLIFVRKYVDRTVLEVIVHSLLTKYQDLDATLDVFERIVHQFHSTPSIQTLTCELINRDDTERLERILSISKNIHGNVNSFYSMAFAFTLCDRIDQARKIFTSLRTEKDSGRLEKYIQNLMLRRQSKGLNNLLAATEGCISLQYREKIYTALLELYAYENSIGNISSICSAMDAENLKPDEKNKQKIIKLLKQRNVVIPECWLSDIPNEDSSETAIRSYLDQNKIQAANKLLYDSFESGISIERKVIRYCLVKNSKLGYTDIFTHLRSKLDLDTQIQLNFHSYECQAYTVANKSHEYLQLIQKTISERDDLKLIAGSFSERVIEMIEGNPEIYENYYSLAKQIADRGVIKPICIIWTYNFVNDEHVTHNQFLWDKYLRNHPTIVCNQVTKILLHRKNIEKLRSFLNLERLDKQRIVKAELGKTYSILFDALYYSGNYDAIIEELEKVIMILPVKFLKANTLNRIKFGSSSLGKKFWNVVNISK